MLSLVERIEFIPCHSVVLGTKRRNDKLTHAIHLGTGLKEFDCRGRICYLARVYENKRGSNKPRLASRKQGCPEGNSVKRSQEQKQTTTPGSMGLGSQPQWEWVCMILATWGTKRTCGTWRTAVVWRAPRESSSLNLHPHSERKQRNTNQSFGAQI